MPKPSLVLKIQKRDNHVCQYCGKDGLESLENWYDTVIDRFNPKKRNAKNNLVTSCHYCNAIKGNKVFDAIQGTRGYIIGKRIQLFKRFLKIRKKTRR